MEDQFNRKRMFCPIMKEVCVNGHTSIMGTDTDGELIRCRFWTHLAGKDPQSEKIVDSWDCAIAWTPILLVEGSQATRQATASVDKVANQVQKARLATIASLPAEIQGRIIMTQPTLAEDLNSISRAPTLIGSRGD